ncbi:chromate efflux transporter [Mastigocoleus sp. MO_188.B34]|uniref:chromate efflux transporter n=1 Tax=Mastigocoleus sp. MO_188.B34 TaxID=3036635 RepID=UPI002638A205|nr:chromate efflux transporter [Mastigocoleus sp. MO_188.B34]MDJ0695598.1 chromate efflux transporter [Mastigocoleus sp. MO_188.B34]
MNTDRLKNLSQLAILCLKLGSTGIGGFLVVLAMMEYEVVTRKKWLTKQKFLDIIGASNLVPGPSSVEVTIHVGYLYGGWLGFVISGICLIFPAALIKTAFAWAYTQFGALPEIASFLDGVKPVVLAVMLLAVTKLGKTAIDNWRLLIIGIFVCTANFFGVSEIILLLVGGAIGMLLIGFHQELSPEESGVEASGNTKFRIPKAIFFLLITIAILFFIDANYSPSLSLGKLSIFFLKVASLLYGSGYVLIAFLQGELVDDFGWLTEQQLLDAIAIAQITPGPLLSSATFIGYLLLGIPGAIVATVSIFLPSFLFSAALISVVSQLRKFRWTSAFLDAVNASSIALMAAVIVKLSQSVLIYWQSWVILLSTFLISFRWKVNVIYLILGGAIVAWILFKF